MSTRAERLKLAYDKDPEIIVDKEQLNDTFGSNPLWLLELGITKSDLIRLERKGLAAKARYQIEKTGEHRTRWLIFKEALNEL